MTQTKIKPTEISVEKEEEKKLKAFFDDYKILVEKHGFDIGAVLEINQNGIVPRPKVIKMVPKEEKK